jgi:hypothetical protein
MAVMQVRVRVALAVALVALVVILAMAAMAAPEEYLTTAEILQRVKLARAAEVAVPEDLVIRNIENMAPLAVELDCLAKVPMVQAELVAGVNLDLVVVAVRMVMARVGLMAAPKTAVNMEAAADRLSMGLISMLLMVAKVLFVLYGVQVDRSLLTHRKRQEKEIWQNY